MELLDAPCEFYFDSSSRTIYLYMNGTGAPPSDVDVPTFETVLVVNGGFDWCACSLECS